MIEITKYINYDGSIRYYVKWAELRLPPNRLAFPVIKIAWLSEDSALSLMELMTQQDFDFKYTIRHEKEE